MNVKKRLRHQIKEGWFYRKTSNGSCQRNIKSSKHNAQPVNALAAPTGTGTSFTIAFPHKNSFQNCVSNVCILVNEIERPRSMRNHHLSLRSR